MIKIWRIITTFTQIQKFYSDLTKRQIFFKITDISRGATYVAEMIPVEPDTVRTAVGN